MRVICHYARFCGALQHSHNCIGPAGGDYALPAAARHTRLPVDYINHTDRGFGVAHQMVAALFYNDSGIFLGMV